MMKAHFIGWEQNGVFWEPVMCPSCRLPLPTPNHVSQHYFVKHALPLEKWPLMTIEDPKMPGFKFHFIVDNPPAFTATKIKFGDYSPL